jgi:hypothetical protein
MSVFTEYNFVNAGDDVGLAQADLVRESRLQRIEEMLHPILCAISLRSLSNSSSR